MSAYRTICEASECELIIQKSRFIGRCYPVTMEAEAIAVLEKLRKEHWNASHNCFAYRIGSRAQAARFSDDGEPSGTAGQPIMEVLARRDATNLICVVTRYFGGILLGAGGLVRAYSSSCARALDAAGLREIIPCVQLRLAVPYPLWEQVKRWLTHMGETESVSFTQAVSCEVWVKKETLPAFAEELAAHFGIRVTVETVEESERPFPIE